MKSTRFIIVLLVLFLYLISCKPKDSQNRLDYSRSLIKVSGAMNVQYSRLNGTDQVQYKVIVQYPAKDTISELNSRLKAKGWEPLKKSWLNPEIPTSHERGWTNFIDGTKKPNLEVHSWHSDWINKKEDILTFALKYSYPVKTKSSMLELNVLGIYVPEELAKKGLAQINEYKKSIGEN